MSMFCQAVDAGGFSAAARRFGLTPSAVSKQITRLEDRLGARLMNRTTRRVSLTEEGRAFYERSKAILADIDEAERAIADAQSRPRGKLKINAPVGFGRRHLTPLLPRFMTANPDVEIELELSDRQVNLLDEGIDVLLRSGELSDSSHVARRLALIRRYICASPDYLERHPAPATPEDLLDHNCLLLNHPSSYNDWAFDGPGGKRVIHAAGNFSSNISGALEEAVVAGIGIARLSSFMIGNRFDQGLLVPLLGDYTHDPIPLYVIYPHRRHLSPKVRTFVDFLVNAYTPNAPWETTYCKLAPAVESQ